MDAGAEANFARPEGRVALMATVVAFHAHPDDEVLLTGGTISRLAADGHRVVVVVACDGDMWAGPDQGRRLEELRASAALLGAERVVHLGYAERTKSTCAGTRRRSGQHSRRTGRRHQGADGVPGCSAC
jgi:LmbE family N-acetylglucosaminyl deacetylase